ncbi:thiamine pyrophosphate-dependent dehydrogenase E1 component subunit alpha [Maridesulfovibrio zosterae]|uniref:thiamine pyrophosphate-dependent dehydrogenase E1 component subunit alpha n=1 Tax=Maridesulfovibrio zosterae TaxID=82171 RepID=UPI0003F5D731|nr:thiamine pyrophosphate-dependent dehydrogenase E1 component subunit alpha [Maridesulfovibrio zosterae]
MKLHPDNKRTMYRDMLRIRMVQERIEAEYLEDRMRTPVHLCVGQEASAVGVCATLRKGDYISSNHRGHGHYLAKGGDLKALMAELHCKTTGCAKGYGGSMHLVDTSVGNMGHSAIVGGGIPIGTGQALASKMLKQDRVSVVFFGDGAADEGTFYESVNFAMLKKLPVVYVLENNGWAVCSPTASRQLGKNVFLKGAAPELLSAQSIDGNDVELIYEKAIAAVERARSGLGPSLIECKTYRMLGHAGCKAQDAKGYRDEQEVEKWAERCPLQSYGQKLIKGDVLTQSDIDVMQREIAQELDEAFRFALESPLPTEEDLHKYLFCE